MAAVVTGWEPLPTPTVGVIGPSALGARLGRVLRVERFVPTAAAVGEVDAVLVARSALCATGSWGEALRPVGFDRGVVLAQVLRDARAMQLPVVLVEDLHGAAVDGWHGLLDGAVDDALTLGPLGAGGVCWHPGICWDALALRLAVARPLDSAGSVQLPRSRARGDWIGAQREAVVAGRATVDSADPWSRHLGAELVQLGVAVRDAADGSHMRRFDDATPSAAATWLCDHLGLPSPPSPRAVVRPGGGGDERAAVACRTALERLGEEPGVAVRLGATVAAGPGLRAVEESAGADQLLREVAVDLEALA